MKYLLIMGLLLLFWGLWINSRPLKRPQWDIDLESDYTAVCSKHGGRFVLGRDPHTGLPSALLGKCVGIKMVDRATGNTFIQGPPKETP